MDLPHFQLYQHITLNHEEEAPDCSEEKQKDLGCPRCPPPSP